MDDLYQQQILDHYKNPRNTGELANADVVVKETNSSCGDSVKFYLKWGHNAQGQKIIQDVKFQGVGCAISTAATSLLTEQLIGQPVSVVDQLTPEFMQDLIGAEITPSRLKCLMLPARALSQSQRV
jgi:nitrogen fixation protein NifU and related proteins